MKLFICNVTGKEAFSDAYKYELVDDFIYEVHGMFKATKGGVDESLIGGNKSAEDTTADSEEVVIVEADAVKGSQLEEIDHLITKKKEFLERFAKIGKRVLACQGGDADKAAKTKEQLNKFAGKVKKDFTRFRFFATEGDEYDLEGTLIVFENLGPNGDEETVGTKFKLYVLKDCVTPEKV